MKKRIVSLILSAILAVSLAACGKGDSSGKTDTESKNTSAGSESTYTETYEWNVSITFGEPATRNILAMLDEVEEKNKWAYEIQCLSKQFTGWNHGGAGCAA